jgi:two-component system, sensor histidine kinase and response regulator
MPLSPNARSVLRLALCPLLAAVVFTLDLALPGFTGGLPYVLVVLLSLGFPRAVYVAITAVACTLLAIVGLIVALFSADIAVVPVLINYLVGLSALWATTIIGLQRKRAVDALRLAHQQLEKRVAQRTQELEQANTVLRTQMAERKSAEARLREAEVQYAGLIESLPLNVFRKDLAGRVVMANKRYCETLNRPLAELLGKTDYDLFPRKLADKYSKDDAQVVKTGEMFEDIEQHRKPNGELIYVQVFKAPVRDAEGRAVGVQILFWDVSARRRAEVSLLQERYLLRSLMDSVPDSIYYKDSAGRFIRINKALANRFGLADPSYAEGKTDFDFFTPEHAQPAHDDEQQIMRTGQSYVNKEEKETWRDGSMRWVSTTKVPLRDEDGKIIGTFGISRDITYRKQAEESLRENAERLRLIVDTAYDAFVAMDADGKIIDWNPRAEAIFGWTREEAVGRTVAETLIPPRFRDDHERGLKRFLATGEGPLLNNRIEIRALHRDGREFPAELTIAPIRVGDSFLFNAFLHDITQRKQAEDDLKQAKEAAEAANHAKSLFLANMSHEIRTPLNAILGMTELVLDTELGSVQREYLTVVQESGDALLTIIGDILDFSKIEAGHLELDPAPFNLCESIPDMVKSLALRAHHKKLELACHLAPDVPETVVGDRARLRQVIVNLLGNAVKFTERGEVLLDVSCDQRSDHEAIVHFAVTDTGIGIPPEKHKRIFDAFEQADNTMTRRYGGTGLGLAIASRLVSGMGGRIWVDSEVGRGSTFHFTARFELIPNESLPVPLDTARLEGMPVLIVDDNATNLRILAEMLHNWRMRPTLAASVHEARRMLDDARRAGSPFPLVLSDVQMPEADGFSLAEQIREQPGLAGTVIMMLSSCDRPGDVARCERLGVSTYLVKPVHQSELFDAIVLALGVRSIDDDALPPDRQPTYRLRPLRILLAEDSLVNQKLTVGLMRKHGHEIVVANNGAEAVAALADGRYDLVLMDVQMPEMDGLEAAAIIRAEEYGTSRHIPIVAMTAHAMASDREQCLKAGMDGYVTKPVRSRELFTTIEQVLEKSDRKGEAPAVSSNSQTGGNGSAAEPAESVDWSAALDAVQQDRDLLAEVIGAFLEECPELMGAIRNALNCADAPALRIAAHRLKGSMRYFGATRAFDQAYILETLGRDGRLAEAPAAIARLDHLVSQLSPQLASYLGANKSEQPA